MFNQTGREFFDFFRISGDSFGRSEVSGVSGRSD